MKLTAKTIAGLELPRGKTDVIHFDEGLPGFGLRLRAGSDRLLRSWVCQFRVHGKTQRYLIGRAETLTVDQARTAAKKILGRVALGGNPQAEKTARRQKDVHSLRSVVDDYLVAKKTQVRSRTFAEATRYLKGPYFRSLHSMPIDQITRRDVASCLTKIIAQNGSITAARARVTLSAAYSWALQCGLCEINAVVGTIRPADAKPRERVLTDAELAAIWRASGDNAYGTIIKLLILLGASRAEIGGMRWGELDLERWSLDTAGRAKQERPCARPATTELALGIIEGVPRRVDRDQLFGTRSPSGLSHWHEKHDLDQRLAGTVKPWRMHDLRRTSPLA